MTAYGCSRSVDSSGPSSVNNKHFAYAKKEKEKNLFKLDKLYWGLCHFCSASFLCLQHFVVAAFCYLQHCVVEAFCC